MCKASCVENIKKYLPIKSLSLVKVKNSKKLWFRGGLSKSYLAETDVESYLWRQNYVTNFLERDIPSLGCAVPAQQMRRFMFMLTYYHGQLFITTEIAKSLMVSNYRIRKYLDILAGTFMVRILSPWFENLQKRQVKSPKIYFRDSGVLHALLGIGDEMQLYNYPKLGSFWEGFALEEVIRTFEASLGECYFWATQADAELDLFIIKNNKRLGFEFKYTDAPKVTKSMRIALEDLKLDHLGIFYPGDQIFPLDEKITVFGLETIASGDFMKKIL